MSGGGGSDAPSQTTTTTTSELPKWVKPYAVNLLSRAGDLSNAPYQAYPGERIAPFTDQHIMGLQGVQDRALGGDPTMNTAQSNLYNTMQGEYFGPGMGGNPFVGVTNPYLEQTISDVQRDAADTYNLTATPRYDQLNRQSGSFGHSGLAEMESRERADFADNLNQQTGQMRYQNYAMQPAMYEQMIGRQQGAWDAERARQMQAASMVPQFDTTYQDAQNLLGVGDILRDYNQQQLQLGFDNWQSAQQWPYQQLDTLANAVRTTMGGGGTNVVSAPQYEPNRTASMLGGGMLGYGLGNEFGYGGMGGLAGAALGGLWS